MIHSKNASSAENQQERLNPYWIVGFVDGEGCFSVSRFKNKTCKSGYQILYEFVVTQGESSREAMDALKSYFECGHIYINRRHDNHRENLLRYCVRKQFDLKNIIIPFFQKYRLQTNKQYQFENFSKQLLKDSKSPETTRQTL